MFRPLALSLVLISGCWLIEGAPDASYAKIVLADGPTAYWRVGERAGTVAADLTPNRFPGAYQPGVTYGRAGAIAADADSAVLFAGSGIDLGPEVFVWSGDFSIEAWVAPHVAPPGGAQDGMFIWETYLQRGFRVGWTQLYAPMFWDFQSGGSDSITSPSALVADVWNHIVVTKRGVTVAIFLDGELAVSGAAATYQAPMADEAQACWGSCSGVDTSGDFDELAIYPRALSAEQIRRHYQAGVGQ